MKFEELPEIPESWCQFLRGNLPFSPASSSIPALVASADAARNPGLRREVLCRQLANDAALCFGRAAENVRKLARPESVAVVTNLYPALFGGPAFQLFKCLTAVKICEELNRRGLEAIPVCWISDGAQPAFSTRSVQMLNADSGIYTLDLGQQRTGDALLGDTVEPLLAQMEESGRGAYDPEALKSLASLYVPGATLAGASARLVAALMQEWGMIVSDPRSLDLRETACQQTLWENAGSPFAVQRLVLPVIAAVIDPFELDSFGEARALCAGRGQAHPMAWPQASVTVVDGRSRRILDRYGLEIHRLFAGPDAITGEIMGALPENVPEKLSGLKLEMEMRLDALCATDSAGGELAAAAVSGKEKISYQLDRLRQKYESARNRKEATIRRQLSRVCNSLAPNGRIQEREIAGMQIVLRYSRAVLPALYEKLDILSFEHQLISMD